MADDYTDTLIRKDNHRELLCKGMNHYTKIRMEKYKVDKKTTGK